MKLSNKRPAIPANITLILGITLLFCIFVWRFRQATILAFSSPEEVTLSTSQNYPVSITIDRLDLALPIQQTTVTDGTWEISPYGASHWNNSANPGDDGNIVIYAHNTTDKFGSLHQLKQNDVITLKDAHNQTHQYTVTATAIVKPDDTRYIRPAPEETLTLYTCTGWFDNLRQIVTALPVDQEPASRPTNSR